MSSKAPPPPGGSSKDVNPNPPINIEIPKDQPKVAQAAAPVATLSSHVDPWPHYLMSGACAGAAGYSYSRLRDPRAATIAAAFSAAYFFAGRLVHQGHSRLGYDVGTATSLGLIAAAGPKAYQMGDTYSTALASLGFMSTVANLIKSYQARTGKPKEAVEK